MSTEVAETNAATTLTALSCEEGSLLKTALALVVLKQRLQAKKHRVEATTVPSSGKAGEEEQQKSSPLARSNFLDRLLQDGPSSDALLEKPHQDHMNQVFESAYRLAAADYQREETSGGSIQTGSQLSMHKSLLQGTAHHLAQQLQSWILQELRNSRQGEEPDVASSQFRTIHEWLRTRMLAPPTPTSDSKNYQVLYLVWDTVLSAAVSMVLSNKENLMPLPSSSDAELEFQDPQSLLLNHLVWVVANIVADLYHNDDPDAFFRYALDDRRTGRCRPKNVDHLGVCALEHLQRGLQQLKRVGAPNVALSLLQDSFGDLLVPIDRSELASIYWTLAQRKRRHHAVQMRSIGLGATTAALKEEELLVPGAKLILRLAISRLVLTLEQA